MDRRAGRSGRRTAQILAGWVTLFPGRVESGHKIWTRMQLWSNSWPV